MTDRPGESAEPPSSLNLPDPPPPVPQPPAHIPPGGWSEPPAAGPRFGETSYGAPPPPSGVQAGYRMSAPMAPEQQRLWAMLAHLSALGALVIGVNFLGPLLIFIGCKDRGAFVRDQAVESLNFQITVCIAGLVSIPLTLFFGLGVLTFLVTFIGWLILSVMAGIAANNGQPFRYPVNLRLVK
jgi:uncharacterized Tic20 family protein